MTRCIAPLVVSALALQLASVAPASAQTASTALDSAWLSACASATPGTAFYTRCQEILNAGPGSADRRSAAALGNNLELFASQGRRLMAMARARGKAAARSSAHAVSDQPAASQWMGSTLADDEAVLAGGSRWALLGSAARIDGQQAETGFERGSDDSGDVLMLGLDYRFDDRWTGLVSLQRESRDVDFRRGSGGMESDTDLASVALAYGNADGFSANVALSAGQTEAQLRREIDYTLVLDAGTPQQRTVQVTSRSDSRVDGEVRGAELAAGWERSQGAWTWRYGADLSWQRSEIDNIIEDNDRGLDFLIRAQSITSLQSGAQIEVARTFSTRSGVWQPWLRLRAIHEFRDDARQIQAAFRGGDRVFRLSFSTAEPDRNFGEIGLGISTVFVGGWQAYAGWQRLLGHDFIDEDRFDIGWRREF